MRCCASRLACPAQYHASLQHLSRAVFVNFELIELRSVLKRSVFSASPNRRKCVGLSRLCVDASLSRPLSIGLWINAYRQNMLPGRQHRVVTLTELQLRNLDAIDEYVDGFENSKIGSPIHNQTSAIARTGQRLRCGLLPLNWRACRKAACNRQDD